METMTDIVFGTATIAVTLAVLYIVTSLVLTRDFSEKIYGVTQYINEKSFAGFFVFAGIFAVVAFVTMVLEIIYKFI